jgi:hypothetical protein
LYSDGGSFVKNILLVILTMSVTQIVAGDAADKKQDKNFLV